ncbi:cobyrinate a,c-diamide synthase [Streptomyces sp. DSM 44917]|uniref:Hydrogenobyrinate a,c-diamide synthase n=1 Tax=Streptomyces boetiae TaxID=3075541 RepID=A0ABU2L5E2_9ACTN|nr:cobyrinate a,c-diamide synthase [Streptomyces sp. DSM 44917]MDT0306786.1 cobyrinate a,c-diamide synthase [Streptomyces sp. DSM 44917]
MPLPRLVVAAPASGSGKTTVATGLMAALAARGLSVSGHKVGPDYIDPGYHALATGRPGRNLDPWLCGPELIGPLCAHGAAGADVAVVEGVMGLFDGAAGEGELGSTAQVAKLLRAPVVLVVDAAKQSRSVAALVHGFASWDTGLRLAGVILNKVASDRHEELLREALEGSGVPVLGALRRAAALETPARHLGLIPAAERRDQAVAAVAALAERVRAGVDLEAVLAVARSAPPLPDAPWRPPGPEDERPSPLPPEGAPRGGHAPSGGAALGPSLGAPAPGAHGAGAPAAGGGAGAPATPPVVAVAGGPAFTFGYAEHPELLRAAGAEVVTFDPLREERLPEGTAALVIGGGFPEVYAEELAANRPLRAAVAAFGGPVAAECAGLLYLARSLDGRPMCGVLDAEARMTERLTLGYRAAVAVHDSPLAAAGTRVRGHEFHRTALEPPAGREPGERPAWGLTHPAAARGRTEGFVRGPVHASYLHLHWAGQPRLARRLVAHAAAHAALRARRPAGPAAPRTTTGSSSA